MAITPYLFYRDVAAARRFLSRAFGLKNFGATNRNAEGVITHSAMKLDKGVVMMGYPGRSYKNPKKLGQATQCLYVDVGGVDEHCARARKSGARIIEEPKDTPYGARRYGAEDPEGHQWYFAQQIKPRKRK